MRRIILVVSVLLFTSAGLHSSADTHQEFELTQIKVGLVCSSPYEDGSVLMWPESICVETDEIMITGQGQCEYGGEWKSCTWFGFELIYAELEEDVELSCSVKTQVPITYGDYEVADKEKTSLLEFDLLLEEGTSRFFNPQYALIQPSTDIQNKDHSYTECKIRDSEKVLFSFERTVVYPVR